MTTQENTHSHPKKDSLADDLQKDSPPKVSSKAENKETRPEEKPSPKDVEIEKNTKVPTEDTVPQNSNQDTSPSPDLTSKEAAESQGLPKPSVLEKSPEEKIEAKTTKIKEQTADSSPEDQENLKIKEDKASDQATKKEEYPKLHLNGLYALKVGMSSIYNDQGQVVPVTVLRFDTWRVTQIKTKEKDGYTAIQLGSKPKSERKSNLAQKGHLKPSGFSTNVTFLREIRGEIPSQPSLQAQGDQPQNAQQDISSLVKLGQILSIHSLAKGDRVHLSSISKGRGFAGTMKRWGYGGGPASHGSQFHRKPGSIGMCEEPARVLPGKGMPGHYGSRKVTLKHVEVVDVIPEKKVLLVKGSVPGACNSLVKLIKENV